MDAPVKEFMRIAELQQQARSLLGEGRHAEALASTQQALGLEAENPKTLSLQAEACDGLGDAPRAERLRARVKQLRKEAWQRQVEAEARGHHDLLGEAIRHEKL